MLLKSIEYKDFRPFKGFQKIEFTSPTKSDENVYIILGDNTFGKSTIILSFIWCFYGVSNFNHKKDILNRDVENSMKIGERARASVTVVFEDENREYTITRSQAFVKNYYGLKEEPTILSMKYVDENGQSKDCGQLMSEHEKAIRAMLPYDLSSFFFFEGERDNSISKKDLSLAVKSLLGLEAMAKMKEHMHGNTKSIATNSVLGYYQGKLLKTSKSVSVDSWIKNKETYEQNLEEIKNELVGYTNEIAQYESRINKTREILIKAEPTKEIQGKINSLLNEIKQDEEVLKKQRASYLDYFNKYAIDLLAYPLYKRSTEKLSEMNLEDKGIIGIEVTAIKELLERGTCLCGTDLNEGSAAYKNVESYIDILPPKSVGTLVREMKEKITLMEDGASEFLNEFEDKYKEIQYTLNRISRNQRRIEELEEELKALDKINSTQYEADLRSFIRNKDNLEEKRTNAIKRQGALEDKLSNCNKNLENAEKDAAKNEKAKLAYDYANLIYKWINDTYERKEDEMRMRLQNLVTEKFNNMYSGKREVRINENYQIEIFVNGKPLDDTGGLRVIQYFAYVAGLVHLASQVMAERKDDEKLGEEYPLVLDAAFSHADEGHVKSISRELASSTKQLVLAVMPKDWSYASETISEKVARVYRLNKISETYVRIEEVV